MGRAKRGRGGFKDGLGGTLAATGFAGLNGGAGGNRSGGWRMRGAIRTDHNLVKVLPTWNRRGGMNWVVLFEKVIAVRAEVEVGKGSRE